MNKHHRKTETPAQPASVKSPSESGSSAASDDVGQVQKGKANSEEVVRVRAHQKWETAGKPNGDGVNFWLEAEQEVLQA